MIAQNDLNHAQRIRHQTFAFHNDANSDFRAYYIEYMREMIRLIRHIALLRERKDDDSKL